jgi:thymidylate synthase
MTTETVSTWEHQYLDLLRRIYEHGEDRLDRTGTGTRALFAERLDIDLSQGFPLVTTKRVPWKSVVTELKWFLEGSNDERRLAEILHGTRDDSKSTIWTANAQAEYWKPKANFNGDLGRVYGVQWRSWKHTELVSYEDVLNHENGATYFNAKVKTTTIDQIAEAIQKIKTNPTDRRIMVSAWNVGEISQMALPPCHWAFQLYVSNDGKLSMLANQRSVDTVLGLPFNIASYALLTHLIAHVTDLEVGRLIMNLGDTHIYKDHLEAVPMQLARKPFETPAIALNPEVSSIDDFKLEDIELVGYKSHEAIKLKMSV